MQCNLLFRSVRGSTQGKEMHLMAVKNRENVFWFGDVFIFETSAFTAVKMNEKL